MSCIASAGVFEKRMKEVPGLFDVNSDLQIASPTVKVDIDRDHASTMGVTADKIENALYDAFGQRQVSDIYTPTNDYQVLLELLPRYPDGSGGAASAVRSIGRGQAGAAGRGDQAAQHGGPAVGGAPGPIAIGDHVVQSCAGRFAGRCRGPH